MRKTVLLINKSGLNEPFLKALQQEGFDVVSFFDCSFSKHKNSILEKYINIYRRVFLNDKLYLQRVEKAQYQKIMIRRAAHLSENFYFDHILFFRGDLYPEEMIKQLRNIGRDMISIQYDGLVVSKKIFDYQHYFDRCYLFDPADYSEYKDFGFLPITNCWFDDPNRNLSDIIKQDLYYVGVGLDDRRNKILHLQEYCDKEFSLKALLTIPKFRDEEEVGNVRFSHDGLSYDENIEMVKSSKALIDFKDTIPQSV